MLTNLIIDYNAGSCAEIERALEFDPVNKTINCSSLFKFQTLFYFE